MMANYPLCSESEYEEYQELAEEYMSESILTRRQAEVAALLNAGYSYEEMAVMMGISSSSVRTHAEKLREVVDRAEWTLEHVPDVPRRPGGRPTHTHE